MNRSETVRQGTYMARAEDEPRAWYVIDAEGKVLGRLASEVAAVLRGKHKVTYTPHADMGDGVIVVNAAKVRLTGDKLRQKMFRRHSGYLGGLKEIPYSQLMRQHPEVAVEHAVRGMLPKTRLGAQMYRRLRVYAGPEHPHQAQKPLPWNAWQTSSSQASGTEEGN